MALRYGGLQGISSLDLIESAIGRPYTGYYYRIYEKCAALLESCVRNHGFVDGNKRTAWLLVEILVERSGYELEIPDDAPVDDLVVEVARSEIALPELTAWFRERLVRAK